MKRPVYWLYTHTNHTSICFKTFYNKLSYFNFFRTTEKVYCVLFCFRKLVTKRNYLFSTKKKNEICRSKLRSNSIYSYEKWQRSCFLYYPRNRANSLNINYRTPFEEDEYRRSLSSNIRRCLVFTYMLAHHIHPTPTN